MPELNSTYRHPVKGKTREYACSPLTDVAHEALDAYVRAIYMERQAKLIDALKTERQQDVAIRGAMQQAASLQWLTGTGFQIMSGVDGMLRILYEGCRINDPTLEFVSFKQDILGAYETQAEAVRQARLAFDITNPKVPGAPTQAPTTGKSSRSRSTKSTRS